MRATSPTLEEMPSKPVGRKIVARGFNPGYGGAGTSMIETVRGAGYRALV